jgi:hypothetical protein
MTKLVTRINSNLLVNLYQMESKLKIMERVRLKLQILIERSQGNKAKSINQLVKR